MNEIVLNGCRPAPLASYLKALGVMRLVAEQADSKVKGCWRDDSFVLQTELTKDALIEFFVDEYQPTPIVAPWNGGSGFYPGDPSEGIDAILGSEDGRFATYREVINNIRSWPEMPRKFETVNDVVSVLREAARISKPGKKCTELEQAVESIGKKQEEAQNSLGDEATLDMELDDLESRAKELKGALKKAASAWWKVVRKGRTQCLRMERGGSKEALLTACRSRLPDECLSWVDATVVIRNEGTPAYNPLLGSGGNEGRLDFSNNFMQRLAELLIEGDRERTIALLRSAVLGEAQPGMVKASIGQFDPGRAGGYNQGAEVETKRFKINPWDFVFMLEGASALSSAVARRSNTESRGHATIPFTVSFSGVGFSSSEHDEDGRAEIWLPTWSHPAGYREVGYLFGEGRSTVGRRVARNGLDFTRAVGSLGVDRGVDGFVRYAFIKRRGDSFVALPAGRLPVRFKPELRLLDDLDPIIERLDGFMRRFPNIPATFESARRNIDEAIYDCCEKPNPVRFSALVRALGRMEFLVAQRDRSKKPSLSRPLLGLRPAWVSQCDDGAPEVRIASALASIRSTGKVGGIRSNMAGVDAMKPWSWAAGSGQQRWYGSSLVERLGGVLSQRLMDAERMSAPTMPLQGALTVQPHDVVPFLYRETDDRLLEELLWGFTLVEWRKGGVGKLRERWRYPLSRRPLPRSWCLLKLLHMPGKIRQTVVRMEPRISSLLAAGRVEEATDVAYHRLRVSNLKPIAVQYEEWTKPDRLLAGLLIPTGRGQLESLVLEEENEPQY